MGRRWLAIVLCAGSGALAYGCSLALDPGGLSAGARDGGDAPADARAAGGDAGAALDGGDQGGDAEGAGPDGAPADAAAVDTAPTGISFVAAGQGTSSATPAVTVMLPQAPQAGDLLLAVVYDSKAEAPTPSTVTPPTGWQPIAHDGYWWTFDLVAGADAQTAYAFAMSTSSAGVPNGVASIAIYRGVDTTSPVDVGADVVCYDGNAAECDGPSVTTTHPDDLVVLLYGLDGTTTSPAWTPPATMRARIDLVNVAIADGVVATAGATGAFVSSHSVTGWSSYVDVVALAPRR